MTGTDIGIVLGGLNTLIITLATVFARRADVSAKRADAKASRAIDVATQGVAVSQSNTRKIESVAEKVAEVHLSTNGLSERNEAIARKLGVAEGTAAEKASHSP